MTPMENRNAATMNGPSTENEARTRSASMRRPSIASRAIRSHPMVITWLTRKTTMLAMRVCLAPSELSSRLTSPLTTTTTRA